MLCVYIIVRLMGLVSACGKLLVVGVFGDDLFTYAERFLVWFAIVCFELLRVGYRMLVVLAQWFGWFGSFGLLFSCDLLI